jgi:A/G-specific adenine glycosylase
VYAYNTPRVFIETNIRTVFIYHFFKGADNVTDNDILPIIQRTLDTHSPREWYWALMDYGSYLKKAHGNAAKNSKHYKRQSNFKGSKRQLRGAVLRELTEGEQTIVQLRQTLKDDRLTEVLIALEKEGLIQTTHQTYHLSS